ncbi:hypothetical protein M2281_002967 [Mesorhizobium soli]|uniref:DUF982 domain-containing protein n=1 Tax=Pseudaminobacter soli (ex Li et al. 2025) TaxID=1295366 RepID=UPI002477290F|nr:DUF982 domain-containing protein [Mesorhizobium soli]MDH6232368.1 hypothetical protein [Mesorhizobium soli]
MDSLQFFMPVRISLDAEKPITEIYGVDQALDFLLAWPTGRQGPIYQKALNACFVASVEQGSAEDARKAFFNFTKTAGILAKDAFPGISRRRTSTRYGSGRVTNRLV